MSHKTLHSQYSAIRLLSGEMNNSGLVKNNQQSYYHLNFYEHFLQFALPFWETTAWPGKAAEEQ